MTISAYAANIYWGLSSDTKPTDVPDNALFITTDTRSIFARIGSAWVPLTLSNFPPYQKGTTSLERWYTTHAFSGAASSVYLNNNSIVATPFWCPMGGTIDRIGFRVTDGAGEDEYVRCGIYAATSASNLYPGNLILDSGQFVCSTADSYTATVSQALDPYTLYWLTINTNVAGLILGVEGGTTSTSFLHFASDLSTPKGGIITVASTYGAFPSTFPVGGSDTTAGYIPLVFVRFSA